MNNEALRLAEELVSFCVDAPVAQAAAELRRLHEVNQVLIDALKLMFSVFNCGDINGSEAHALNAAYELIAKAGESNES